MGCATVQTTPRIELGEALRAPCEQPAGKEDVKTVSDLASFSIRQDAALRICEEKRKGLASILDAVSAPAKKTWWRW